MQEINVLGILGLCLSLVIDISCTPDREILQFTPCEKFLSHPWRTCKHMFRLNIGCIGRQVMSSLSAHVTPTSEKFNFKMADAIAVFFNANVMKIKCSRIKACKKKNLSCM